MGDLLEFATARANYEMAQADLTGPPGGYDDAECDYLVDIATEALKSLLICPAPNLAALAYKLDAFASEDCFGFTPTIRDPLFAALKADVARLSATGGGAT